MWLEKEVYWRADKPMMRGMPRFLLALAAFAAGFVIAPVCRGQVTLLAYEGFDYAAGTLNGQNGGSGWSGAWTWTYGSGGSLGVAATGLTYTGLTTTGRSATWSSGGNGISEARRSLPLVNSGVVYLQFLTQFGASSGGGTPNLRLFANGVMTGGIGANGGTYGGVISILDTALQPASGGASSSSATLSALNLLVVRIDYTANATMLWTNPNLATFDYLNPGNHDAIYEGLAPAFDTLDFYTRNPGRIDEIAVYSAIPEPATTASLVAGMALVAASVAKRRRRAIVVNC